MGGHGCHRIFRRERERMPSRGNTCLNEVFSLKNISNFIHDDIIFSPPESIKMNMLNNHLNMTRGHRHKARGQASRQVSKINFKDFFSSLMIHIS